MPQLLLIEDLAVIMCISALTVLLCRLVRLPVVLGYIIAGVIIGPYTPPHRLVTDVQGVETLSDLGVIFLLFSIGLEFSLKKLLRVGPKALAVAVFEIMVMIGIGYGLGRLFGWNGMDAIFLGAILSISSTTIVAKLLSQMKLVQEKFAPLVLGILVVEDLLAIVIIAVLAGLASAEAMNMHNIQTAVFHGAGFIAVVLVVGVFIVPRFLEFIMKFKIPEMTVITVLGLCFAVARIAEHFGFSLALGAFLIGALIAETKGIEEIIHKMEPIRDMFSAVFFMSVGMLIDPSLLWRYKTAIGIITIVTILGKFFTCSTGVRLTGNDRGTALMVGVILAQIGEFSFIIARLGDAKDVTSPFLYSIAVSVSVLTTALTPLLMKLFLRRRPIS